MRRGPAIVAALLFLGPWAGDAAAEEIVFSNGNTLEVQGHRREGEAIWLFLEGGGSLAVLAAHVREIRSAGAPEAPPVQPPPSPAANGSDVPTGPDPAARLAPAESRRAGIEATGAPLAPPAEPPQPPAAAGSDVPKGSDPAARRAPVDGLQAQIEAAAARHGVDPRLVSAVVEVESGGDPRAVSPKGAMGLMQLMPATARARGVADAFDVSENLDAGTAELAAHLEEFSGELSMALAAYNAGPGAVGSYKGIPPYRETLGYVQRVLDLYFAETSKEAASR